MKPNVKILSEEKLAQQYNVSRLTARNAVVELVNEGYLYRIQGQGTFVSKPKVGIGHSEFSGFIGDMSKMGFKVHSQVLEATEIIPDKELKEALRLKEMESVYKLVRLRFANEEPIVIQESYLPSKRCTGLLDLDLENCSLYKTLRNKYHIRLVYAHESLTAIAASQAQADLLRMESGSPLLYFKRVTFSEQEFPIEYVRSWFRGDRYVYEIELKG